MTGRSKTRIVQVGLLVGGTTLLTMKRLASAEDAKGSAAGPDAKLAAATSSGTAAPAVPAQAKPKPTDEVNAKLDGTQWSVEWASLTGGPKAKPKKDTFSFSGPKVSSQHLSKRGYPDSNYTLTIGNDGVPVWETMQTKEGEGVVFLRGELHGSSMRGVISMHPKEGSPEDFSFSGAQAGGPSGAAAASSQPAEAEAVSPPTPAPTAATQAAAPTNTEPPKKKKRGWLGR